MMIKKYFSIVVLFFTLCGCGAGSIVENTQATTTQTGTGTTSLNLAPADNVFVLAANFTDPVGSIATVGLNNPHTTQKARAITDGSDAVIRSFDGKLYVVNRGRTSSIQVIDPDSFSILADYSVGSGSNPQDLVVTNGKAYVTRLDAQLDTTNQDDLWVIDPLSGLKRKTISLKSSTDSSGDRLARAQLMALVGDKLYVLVEDLSQAYKANTNGKVAVIDTKTDTLLQTIQLVGRNPTDIQYSSTLNRLFIADSGFFDASFNNDTSTAYGGIEEIDLATNTSLGIVVDDALCGGYISLVRLVSDTLAVATANAATIITFNPTTATVLNKNFYKSAGGFLPELLVDKNGLLWIPERDPKNAGLLLMDPQTGASIAGSFAVGAFPASLTIVR